MPELHIQRSGEHLITTFAAQCSTVPWAEIALWTPKQVSTNAEAFGHSLFEQITRDAGMREALIMLRENERLVLVADQPEVAAIPWEYLRFPSDGPLDGLLLAAHCNFVRGVPEEYRRDPVVPQSPLTIVAIPASPVELPALNTEEEWHTLTRTMRAHGCLLTLTRIRPPTLDAMSHALSVKGTKIVQFMGHSKVENGKGMLQFEDDLGRTEAAHAALFVNSLDEQTLLVVLASRDSAVSFKSDAQKMISPLSNIAQAVVREGVPYALGMQFELPDNAILEITHILYESLLQGHGIEEAVRRMRSDLGQSTVLSNAHWLAGVLILYTNMRTPASAIKLDVGEPIISPYPIATTETSDLSALSQAEHFVGRGKQISEALSILLNASAHGFVLLHGPGGIGKTALARVIAERVRWQYQDHMLAYSFETFARSKYEGELIHTTINAQFAERFSGRLASFYGLNPRRYQTLRDLQNAILQRRNYTRSLLILDNIETLIYAQEYGNTDAIALVSFISRLKEGYGVILLTAREMPPTDWGQRKDIHLTGLHETTGAELFLTSIANDRRQATTQEDRVALSRYVKGHPLCIRLLAGCFSDDSAADLATFLKSVQDELVNVKQMTSSSTDDLRRHATVSDCMDYSIRHLTSEQARVLYTIGIFLAPFLLKYAEAVLDDKAQTQKHLQDLVRLGLLERTHVVLTDGQFDVYGLHPMLRLHIESNVVALDAETRQRYGLVYANMARQAYLPEGGYDQSASMRYLLFQSLPDCEAVLMDENIAPPTRSSLAYYLALPYRRMGQTKHALALYEQALHMQQELGDVREIVKTQGLMAGLLVQQGRMQEAIGLYEQVVQTYQVLEDVRGIAAAHINLGGLLWLQGEYVQALMMVWNAYKSVPESDFPRDEQITRGFLISFKEHFSGEALQFDAFWMQATSEPQPVWLLEARVGSSVEDDTIQDTEVLTEVEQAIVAFINAVSLYATQYVVEQWQDVLYKPETETIFEQYIEQARVNGEQSTVEILEIHLSVLRECKTDGIEAAFKRMEMVQQKTQPL